MFSLIYDEADWLCELDFELWQRMTAKERRFLGQHNLDMFAIPPCERDLFCKAI